MKRFYKLVSTHEIPGGYAIHLDGRPVKTPSGRVLLCDNENLAAAIQAEWAAQETNILPDTMPLTQILTTRLDQVTNGRDDMTAMVLRYLDTDLLCYRAGELPEGMNAAQAAAWDPWLSWFGSRFGATLETTTGLAALSQPEVAHKAVAGAVRAMDDARFTVLQIITPLSGSLVLGLAFAEREISPQELFAAMRVEENIKAEIYNESFYGADPAQSRKDEAIRRDIEAAARFLDLLD